MPAVDTIYFVHHSHTDIGYTHDQPIVWDLHERFISQAIDCAERWADREGDAVFRWTVESTAALWRWLQQAPASQIDRFAALEKAGRIEVTAMLANITPLYDIDQLIESLQLVRNLRNDYGFTIRHAMNCDVNGQNWPLVDILLDMGIEAFSMAVNPHYGAAPFQRPNGFWWVGPSGRKLLTWNGWLYITGSRFGIGEESFAQFEEVWWPRVAQFLSQIDYPHSALLIQSAHPFGDNGSAFDGFSTFIERWNAAGKLPRIKFATPSMWWDALRAKADQLPAYRGDWTDYWNFGCISSAREQAINRTSRTRLRTADGLAATLLAHKKPEPELKRVYGRYREDAWHHLHFWDEHTWGADQAIHQPYLEDVASQWNHKAQQAYQARSLSMMLQRDGLAALAQQLSPPEPDSFLLYNPLPWPRVIAGDVAPGILSTRNLSWDDTASRHFQDRMIDMNGIDLAAAKHGDQLNINARLHEIIMLMPTEVPGFGYKVVTQQDFRSLEANLAIEDSTVVENHRYRLTFDLEQGGIQQWYDKQLAHEWVDPTADKGLHSFVHETLADQNHSHPRNLHYGEVWDAEQVDVPEGWEPDWEALRRGATAVVSHKVYQTPLGTTVVQLLEALGCEVYLKQEVFLPNFADYIECSSSWQMGLSSYPEATYLQFALNLPGADVRFDSGGLALMPEKDQLPDVCRDYFTVQNWVDFNNGDLGMIVATPENPMVQLGDFHFGHRQREFNLERPMFLGWVTNNYWGTNFRAHQPGEVRARYRLLPYQGAFDVTRDHRFGQEAAHKRPLLQQFTEHKPEVNTQLGHEATLLHLPDSQVDSPVITLHVKPAADEPAVLVRLLNTSDETQTATIGSGQRRIVAAQSCTLLEDPLDELTVESGRVKVTLSPKGMAAIRLVID